jgi:gliding motility-associated-like protein
MKKHILILILLFTIAKVPVALASHIMGGEVTYNFNGIVNGQASFTLNFQMYVDRTPPSQFPSGNQESINIGIYNADNNTLITTRFLQSSLQDINPPLPPGCNISGGLAQVTLNTYTTTLSLPVTVNGYKVIYIRCCRNNTILNLVNPDINGTTFLTIIPSPLLRNSSPRFTDLAVPYMCARDTTTIINNAFDPDGDRLIYSFVRPYSGGGTQPGTVEPPHGFNFQEPQFMQFQQGHTLEQPFGPGSFAFIDASTGVTQYYAPNPGAYVITMEIKEFRRLPNGNEVYLGSTRREIQILVRDCMVNNSPRNISSGRTATNTYEYEVVEGQTLQFQVRATDQDNNNVRITASSRILDGSGGYTGPRAAFNNSSGIGSATSSFTWNTQCGMAGTYYMNVKIEDDGCPPKTTPSVYIIHIRPYQFMGGITGPDLVCGNAGNTTYSVLELPGAYTWSVRGGTITSQANSNSVVVRWDSSAASHNLKVVNVLNGICSDSVSKDIQVSFVAPIVASANQTSICTGGNTTLQANGNFTRVAWSPAAGISNPSATQVTVAPTQSTTYYVQGIDALGCISTDSVVVTVSPQPQLPVIIGTRVACPNSNNTLSYRVSSPQPGVTYQWQVNGGTTTTTTGNSIAVRWGNTSSTASVSVVATTSQGCQGETVHFPVIVNQLLKPSTPTGPTEFCSNEGTLQVEYILPVATEGSGYEWGIQGGTISSGQGTDRILVNWLGAGSGKLWIQEVVNNTLCFGISDTLNVTILQSPDHTLPITGNFSQCEFGVESTYSLAGQEESTYLWSISPATEILSGQGTPSITVNWGASGTYTIRVLETTVLGCVGTTIDSTFTVNPLPQTSANGNNFSICPETTGQRSYQTSQTMPGSTFRWEISGGTITSGQGSSAVQVNWEPGTGRSLSVVETSLYGCEGSLVFFPLVTDNSGILLRSVSTVKENDKEILIKWRLVNAANLPGNLVIYKKRYNAPESEWVVLANVPKSDSVYQYPEPATSEQSFQYMIEGQNLCGFPVRSRVHNTILLTGAATETETVQLSTLGWNPYMDWETGVNHYELQRTIDSDPSFLERTQLSATTLNFESNNGAEAFQHCYRVYAHSTENNEASLSNLLCLDFENQLRFYNIITPNGDNLNETWNIDNVQLYGNNEVVIFNRLGKEVYRMRNYDNTWNASGLSSGVYFFSFTSDRTPRGLKGHITVMR